MATILCIDDQVEGLVVRKTLLELKGYEVKIASSGEEGLRIARTQHVDAVVLDYRMQPMDGGEVAQALREFAPSVPILMLSGYDVPGDVRECVDSFVRKGDSPGTLMHELEKLVGTAVPHPPRPAPSEYPEAIEGTRKLVASTRARLERGKRKRE